MFYVFSPCFPHEASVSVSEQENYLIMVTFIIHLILFIIYMSRGDALHPLLLMLAGLERGQHFTC